MTIRRSARSGVTTSALVTESTAPSVCLAPSISTGWAPIGTAPEAAISRAGSPLSASEATRRLGGRQRADTTDAIVSSWTS